MSYRMIFLSRIELSLMFAEFGDSFVMQEKGIYRSRTNALQVFPELKLFLLLGHNIDAFERLRRALNGSTMQQHGRFVIGGDYITIDSAHFTVEEMPELNTDNDHTYLWEYNENKYEEITICNDRYTISTISNPEYNELLIEIIAETDEECKSITMKLREKLGKVKVLNGTFIFDDKCKYIIVMPNDRNFHDNVYYLPDNVKHAITEIV